jgi:hypothetical protein
LKYRAYFEKAPTVDLTATSTPIAMVNTREEPRKFVFTVTRDQAQQNINFLFEPYYEKHAYIRKNIFK